MLPPQLFDHTILKADAAADEVKQVCVEAIAYGFKSVCVNGFYTSFVKNLLQGTPVKVCTVVGFPLGQMSTKAKCAEAALAVAEGADEIDMVINVGALKACDYPAVKSDIAQVKSACGPALLKVILETCLLTDQEKIKACQLAEEAGADYVKTSTGFAGGGATSEDVVLMRETVGNRLGVKASGGIRDRETAEAMIRAGASRLGTSRTTAICTETGSDTATI